MATPYTAEEIKAGRKDEAERLAAQKTRMEEWRNHKNEDMTDVKAYLDNEPLEVTKKETPFKINGHVTFNGGAKVSSLRPRYELLDRDFIAATATAAHEGAEKYGIGNWKKGGKDFAVERVRHAVDHLLKWISGDRSEPHLAKVAWGMMVTIYFDKRHPEWFRFEGPECTPDKSE